MRTTVSIDDELYRRALEVADPGMDKGDLFREAMKVFVLELACGTPPTPRERTLGDLETLRQAVIATTDEMLALIEKEQPHDSGCGAVDMAVLASVLLTQDTRVL